MTVPTTTDLALDSGNGTVIRKILTTPLRDALTSEIPVIDVADIFHPDESKRRAVADEVKTAAVNTGFFYIKNHGVDEEVVEAAHENMTKFFRQDLETKSKVDKIWRRNPRSTAARSQNRPLGTSLPSHRRSTMPRVLRSVKHSTGATKLSLITTLLVTTKLDSRLNSSELSTAMMFCLVCVAVWTSTLSSCIHLQRL
ncbi:hypothetical protein VHEMI08543 [[Torrubiella] hemipterigena]|uniref:Non-haem dioxygenase N-terminal domain-containing protein n=1 Tax=[Torrubiella] hemipterigena TaxID=1531966 RepID=A0A0A1T701_9HYPO|nr:hypothetical protein VHEMI08543 [[Torrubiella] hemipterigena]